MNIEIQNTPDNDIINFFPSQPVLRQGSAEFCDRKTLRKSPLAEQIFDIGGISSIFITPDMISVTKNADADWNELKPLIMAEIMDFLSIDIPPSPAQPVDTPDVIRSINAMLNARIRPALKRDGGDVKFISFIDGILTVELQGSCKGCPYALRTLKNGIEKTLQTYIPEIKEVRSSELL